jgi:hypothetical protein
VAIDIYIVVRYESVTQCGYVPGPEGYNDVKRYKFQALVTFYPESAAAPGGNPGSSPRRMVLRGRNEQSHHSQVFTALVSCDDNEPFRPGSPRVLATLRLAGDDVADYLDVGSHFNLWLGEDVGEGVITRRLFV